MSRPCLKKSISVVTSDVTFQSPNSNPHNRHLGPGTQREQKVLLKSHQENRNRPQLGLPLLTNLSHTKGNRGLFLGAAQRSGCHCSTGRKQRAVVRRPRKRQQECTRRDKDWNKKSELVMGTE